MTMINKLDALQQKRDQLNQRISQLATQQRRQEKKRHDRAKLLLGVAAGMLAQNSQQARGLLLGYISKLSERDIEWLRGDGAEALTYLLGQPANSNSATDG